MNNVEKENAQWQEKIEEKKRRNERKETTKITILYSTFPKIAIRTIIRPRQEHKTENLGTDSLFVLSKYEIKIYPI
jgi:hypothetical protein